MSTCGRRNPTQDSGDRKLEDEYFKFCYTCNKGLLYFALYPSTYAKKATKFKSISSLVNVFTDLSKLVNILLFSH